MALFAPLALIGGWKYQGASGGIVYKITAAFRSDLSLFAGSHFRKRVSTWRCTRSSIAELVAGYIFPTGPEAAENLMSKGPTTMKEKKE